MTGANEQLVRRIAVWTGVAVLALVSFFLVTLAIPVPSWRTGRLHAPPLDMVQGGPEVATSRRIWIDTDAACGASPTSDPDDCLAIILLANADALEIAGISTVFGNATLDITDTTTRTLVAMLDRPDHASIIVHRGSSAPNTTGTHPSDLAYAALQRALAEGPLTILALGPLTNVAAALKDRPDLQRNVARLVAVMGHRPGHIFHPSEGSSGGMLFGHGPVFRDLNFTKDPAAAAAVLAMRMPVTLVPYDVARQVILGEADLERMANTPVGQWVASRARGWLKFWREDIGMNGFHPFDLLAAAYVLDPRLFNCAAARAWIGPDQQLWFDWFYRPDALLVGRNDASPPENRSNVTLIYCPEAEPRLKEWLIRR